MILGLDIGGANTKASSPDGCYARSVYLPLWKDSRLEDVLFKIKEDCPDVEKVAVVMTGEGADNFLEKRLGVRYIKQKVESVFDDVYYLSIDGTFEKDITDEKKFFSANWIASVIKLMELEEDFLFIDMGSTTTDIIPVIDGRICSRKTDFERLLDGTLIYIGALRTDVSTMAEKVKILSRDRYSPIAKERYAQMADVYNILGSIKEKDYICETPDGKGRSIEDSKRRLARIVCCDLEDLEDCDVVHIADEIKMVEINMLSDGINKILNKKEWDGRIENIFIAGSGEFVVREALKRVKDLYNITSLAEIFGDEISSVFPAFSVGSLLERSLKDNLI
ncbi:MAG TPA: H4MPT-linked C1 transfer pathway protein [Halobacteria archaeon]|nr:H4MPT-linked C1 transfer pathway protein [Halobacteria archaeon]